MFGSTQHRKRSLALGLLAWSAAVGCSARQAGVSPSDAQQSADNTPAESSPGVGGIGDVANGGQSGGASGGAPGPACYCEFGPVARARIVDPGANGACAVFELLTLPEGLSAEAYYGLHVGDQFGGQASLLCEDAFTLESNDEVYVEFAAADTAGNGCPEYRSCSETECGEMSDLEALPGEEYDEALAEFDRCDTACLESTRTACAAHATESLFSGRVSVARIDDQGRAVFANGETYAVDPDELSAQDCQPTGVPERVTPSDVIVNSGGDVVPGAAPAPAPAEQPRVCPVP